MAGFEIIVRPVVFPAIRPPPARSLAPEDDPDAGICTMAGGAGRLIDLTINESSSWSRSLIVERQREVTPMRIKQKEPDGTINEDNYVDVDRPVKMWGEDIGVGEDVETEFIQPPLQDNEEVLGPNRTIRYEGG